MYRKGLLKLPNEDLGADMYQLLMSKIEQSPFHQYEISNFALDGHESEHNKVYWFNEEYYGFGSRCKWLCRWCALYEYQSSESLYQSYK